MEEIVKNSGNATITDQRPTHSAMWKRHLNTDKQRPLVLGETGVVLYRFSLFSILTKSLILLC